MDYAQLFCSSNFTFLTGASHPDELVRRAAELGYSAVAITDDCSFAGIVKAWVEAKNLGIKLIVGARFELSNGIKLLALAPDKSAYAEVSGFITLARRRAAKGEYEVHLDDLRFRLQTALLIWLPDAELNDEQLLEVGQQLAQGFRQRLWLGVDHQLRGGEQLAFARWQQLGAQLGLPLVACPQALMHSRKRKPLLDAITAIRYNTSVQSLGTRLASNSEAYLKPLAQLARLYPPALLAQTQAIAALCTFDMEELCYQYPAELVPAGLTPGGYLRQLVAQGKTRRWPQGIPDHVNELLEKELGLIAELSYEYYFLTVYDIVAFARSQGILCQGRGSAANSVVCYCLGITEIAPGQINLLFERFISRDRNEPPDIDVDFEHQRREEVIQYIYRKYGRERAALAATVITYRHRSAIRDLGKALGFEPLLVEQLAKSIAWWDRSADIAARIQAAGLGRQQRQLLQLFTLVELILGFPRHLSQHVGGFVISQGRLSDLVPVENAAMPERSIIQWDKEDLESMKLLKVDVLALGMLSTLRRCLQLVGAYTPAIQSLADIPKEDPDTYSMLCQADSVGVFQVESRAQMSMLPRLQPRCFYDLVIQVAIVRPGPIQGDMVHPYLRRRQGKEPITYENKLVEEVLKSTLGVPIFQEQAIRLAMVAAGFSGGEADNLRRAITSWGKNSKLMLFEEKFIQGMLANGYQLDYAQRLFEQIKGFGGYGFPESHSASFALLCYFSSWFKRHHPAAFYCALLNSQPMGFYSPSQLVQDARRHRLQVLPVDVNASQWESSLEFLPAGEIALRLGLHQVGSLRREAGEALPERRAGQAFRDLQDLAQRGKLSSDDLQHLAGADALRSLLGNRHQAHWQAAALKPRVALLVEAEQREDDLLTRAPSEEQEMLNDYASLGLSLRAHPMALLRSEPPFNRCTPQNRLGELGSGRFVRVAGLVTGRQRPGTAKGVIFLTLEDETGNINVIVWKATQEHFRQPLLNARLLLIKGVVEIAEDNPGYPVIHVVAGHLQDYSARLETLAVSSRDFH